MGGNFDSLKALSCHIYFRLLVKMVSRSLLAVLLLGLFVFAVAEDGTAEGESGAAEGEAGASEEPAEPQG